MPTAVGQIPGDKMENSLTTLRHHSGSFYTSGGLIKMLSHT